MILSTHSGWLAFLSQKEIQQGAYFGSNMEQLLVFLRYTSRLTRPFWQGKQIFFLQGSSRLLQASELRRFSSLLAKPHEANMHIPSQPCLLDKQNIFMNRTLPTHTGFLNCNNLNPCNQCHCSLT